MATVAITVHVDDHDLADHIASRLGWTIEHLPNFEVRLVTDEPTFVARMLADWWTEYANELESESEPLTHEREQYGDIERATNDVLAALDRDRS